MTIASNNGPGLIKFISKRYKKENCARVLVDWINIKQIESVTIETPDEGDALDDLAAVWKELLELTDKLGSFPIYTNLPLVRLQVCS